MTLLLRSGDVQASVTMADAIEAMESAFTEEGEGAVVLPPRLNVKAGKGWLRVGPVVLERLGWMGFKAMNLAPGHGVRYQVHLYGVETGELAAIMDAQHLTTLRTGATSAVATKRLARPRPTVVSVLGSGAEAAAQLEAMNTLGIVASARVFSRKEENRNRFVDHFKSRHGIDITASTTAEDAVKNSDIVLAAVKSSETVFFGKWLRPGMHVNSVGTARRDQREIDPVTFKRSDIVVVDTRDGVFEEAGDAIAAKDVMAAADAHNLCDLVTGKVKGRQGENEITLFKSVGTGVQDIALAAVIYRKALDRGLGTRFEGFPILKQS